MTISFFVEETLSDLTSWFIRCWDGNTRDAEHYPYSPASEAKEAMQERLRNHMSSCNHCSQDKPAALEVASRLEEVEDIDISDNETHAIFEALALSSSTVTGKLYGYSDAKDFQGRIILALALIDETSEQFSPHISNRKLLSYLHQLYDLSVMGMDYDREIIWLEYP